MMAWLHRRNSSSNSSQPCSSFNNTPFCNRLPANVGGVGHRRLVRVAALFHLGSRVCRVWRSFALSNSLSRRILFLHRLDDDRRRRASVRSSPNIPSLVLNPPSTASDRSACVSEEEDDDATAVQPATPPLLSAKDMLYPTLPGVSIIRPLKGIDFQLHENLRASFSQSYPRFEVILCVATPDDPCIPVVRQVLAEFPHVDAKLLIGETLVGVNPKVNNLFRALTHPVEGATYDLIWVLDSNTRPARDALRRSVEIHTTPGKSTISLTHNAPIPIHPRSFGARLEQVFLGTSHTRMYIMINWLDMVNCLNGKSNLYRRSDLVTAMQGGTLDDFGECLDEDNLIGQVLRDRVGPHRLAPDPIWQPLGNMPVRAFFSRRIRWMRIRKHKAPIPTLLEPFTDCVVSGLYGSWALAYYLPLIAPYFWQCFALHVLTWYCCDRYIFNAMMKVARDTEAVDTERDGCTDELLRGNWWQWSLAWFVREFTALPIWIAAVAGMHVEWRGQVFRLHWNGKASAVSRSTTDASKAWTSHTDSQPTSQLRRRTPIYGHGSA